MVAAQRELARPQVMAMVEDLVMREASGVLEVMGIPSGVIYLDGGCIAYARASWVPGLAARLRAIAPSLSGTVDPEPGKDADDAESARLAVRHGYLTTAGLHELIGSVVAEAVAVLTVPLAPDCFVAGIRFTPVSTCWPDLFPRLGMDAVQQEAARQAERMAACGLAPTTPVAPRDLAAPCAVLAREQWAVACQIGSRASARDLAMRSGASLADTVQCLGSLVRAGLCAPVLTAGRGYAAAARGPVPSAADWEPTSAARVPTAAHDHVPAATPALSVPAVEAVEAAATIPGPGAAALAVPAAAVLVPAAPEATATVPATPALAVPAPALPTATPVPGVPAQAVAVASVPAAELLAERMPTRPRDTAWPRPPASPGQPPSPELLRKVLNGLYRLS
jgi:hypothetical protein